MFDALDREHLKNKWDQVQANVKAACERSGRSLDEVHVIGVSKTVEADVMNASIEFGVKILGENRVQEILRKYEDVVDGPQWHLIGHLQTNKVKYIIDRVDMIHSVDSIKLAKEINKQAAKQGKKMKVLIQVDMANEASKFGLPADQVRDLLGQVSELDHIEVEGLMFIAPFIQDQDLIRSYFRAMKDLFESLKTLTYDNVSMKHLSMGMTNDYELAIEEGATLLRVGTGIYGPRDYT